MIAAAAAQRGYENSKRRSRAAWTEARRRARQRADERDQAARERAEGRRRWFHEARRNPRHPVAWGYGLAWGVAAAGGAAVAGARGARDGARAGAREGANVGRRAAREGWGLGAAWAEYRRQRDADRDQHARAQREPRQAGASTGGPDPDPPPVMVRCLGCGAAITRALAQGNNGRCHQCLQDPEPRAGTGDSPGGGTDHATEVVEDAVVVEDLPSCPRCGAPVEGQLQPTDDGGACCPDRAEPPPGPEREEEHRGEIDHTDSTDRTHDSDDGKDRTPMAHSQTQTAMSLNGSSLSGGDGEGYAGTVAALERMADLLDQAQQVSTDLGDQVTAKNVDADTITGLSRLSDHIQAGADEARATLAHVQSKHDEVAAAVSGAGGSTEVADADWYDQY